MHYILKENCQVFTLFRFFKVLREGHGKVNLDDGGYYK